MLNFSLQRDKLLVKSKKMAQFLFGGLDVPILVVATTYVGFFWDL